eukprot:TRINITY_DN1444_c0_g1_i2.p1 TRINITY_DN1444_c0_g1~~TRINITY_DN1444_c0_g1_i2.p1  ORF type:complete len:512 (+),score=102.41 TRINITY_DN1444_c0_g1_i2:986-2521(+)
MRAMQRRYAAMSAGGQIPNIASIPNSYHENVAPHSWNNIKGEDAIKRKKGLLRGLSSPEPLMRRKEAPNATPKREVVPSLFDPDEHPVESEPHSWEKVIQTGNAAPSDEFGRKSFFLNPIKPDPNTNLFTQIIIDALEEAKAEDIVVVDTTNKWTFFPDFTEYIWLSKTPQRRMDMTIFASGLSAAHMNNIAASVIDKAKKGLIPCESKSSERRVEESREEIYWRINIPCGKIMVDISHPHRRDWKMNERKLVCQTTEHAGRFMEDLMLNQGWIRAWDYWTPNAPCLPKTDFEHVYAAERAHGWERLDVLKPEYVVTDEDLGRRGYGKVNHRFSEIDLDNPTKEDVEYIREQLQERKNTLNEPYFSIDGTAEQVLDNRAAEIASGELYTNFELEKNPTSSVTDEELVNYLKLLRKLTDHENNIMRESPETKERKDKEWAEYERRREARIRKFGYYDYIELANDMNRRRAVLPDGVRTWDEDTIPDFYITPHPENYQGKPRDTRWGPGWYDV